MKAMIGGIVGLLVTALSFGQAMAYSHSNRYGGSSSWGGGSWSP
jgi:hypothetical protein